MLFFDVLGDRQLTVGKIYCVKLIIMKYRKARGKGLAEKKKEVRQFTSEILMSYDDDDDVILM